MHNHCKKDYVLNYLKNEGIKNWKQMIAQTIKNC